VYDLAVDGMRDIKRFVTIRRVARDPLSGIVDGSNRHFFSTYSPIYQSVSSISLFEGTTPVSSGSYQTDYDGGLVAVDIAPSQQLYATYDLCQHTNTELKRILMSAFDHMEAELARGFRLSSGSLAFVEATEDSTNIYVVGKSGVTDPVCGSLVFSTSRIQRGLLWACIEYTLSLRKLDAAADGFMWREDRGITVDKSRMTQGRLSQLEFINKRVKFYRMAAADEYYTGADHLGRYVSSPATKEYLYDHEWQEQSKDEDWRGTYAGKI
jgi:hypothetical protein